ncbi:Cysteine-rich secretory protein [Gracilaria domingensis]|nr:Cysteine-rich secretory protein [Gracilaria domingensis]
MSRIEIILDMTNEARKKRNLNTLKLNKSLCKCARRSSLGDRLNAVGYDYAWAGENLARNQDTCDEVMKDWMKSKGHGKHILNPRAEDIGIDAVQSKRKGIYWIQVFGQKKRGKKRK